MALAVSFAALQNSFMRKIVLFACLMAWFSSSSFAQAISLTGSTYTENYDGMAATTNYPAGWTGLRFAGTGTIGATLPTTVTDGSANSGAVYNVGITSAADRALGTLGSGSTVPVFGASFTNNTPSAIISLAFSAVHEQWRSGSSATALEKVVFEYSTNATSLNTGTWTAFTAMDLVEILTSTTVAAAVDGNAAANRQAISGTLGSLNIAVGSTFWIRWRDTDDVSSDGIYAVDDFQMVYAASSSDVTPPAISALLPANNATGVAINTTATITFNETIQKGTGNIVVKKVSDNSVVQTIAVSNAAVTVSGAQASFALTLANSTSYYITIDAGAFEDASGNDFAGISAATTWTFTTVAPPGAGVLGTTYNFNVCANYINEGFKTYSVTGVQVWSCTKFGRTYTTDPSTDSAMQMNGFASGAQNNEDWLISPKFDLTGTNIPLLNFSSRGAFAGPDLQLKVSTNYAGSGDPTLATWTTLNGEFPAANSDVWSLSDSINLSAYKTANVHVAWVYTSNTTNAARWTIDDIGFYNSNVMPLPQLVVTGRLLDFREVLAGATSATKTFTFNGANLTSNLTLTAPAGYELSKDGTTFSTSISYTAAEGTGFNTVSVRFKPTAANTVYSGNIVFSGTGVSNSQVLAKGNSYTQATTLNIANWNIEWFGSTSSGQGPTDDDLAQANAKKVMDYMSADAYGVAEIVNTTRFGNLVSSLNGGYSYVIGSDFCSSGGSCNTDQKLAFVYKTSMFSNVTARPLLRGSASAESNWSSGRFPYLVNANVTKNGQTSNINFIVVHAKANTGNTAEQIDAYNRRKAGVQELKDTLDTHFANANIVILGDFNDDLDRTIAPTTGVDTVSSWQPIVVDSTDANHYKSLTLFLSNAGLASTTGFPDVIDHVVVSNEMGSKYVPLSVTIYNDIAALANIADYANTTSDHYPVMTRYSVLDLTAPTVTTLSPANGSTGVSLTPTLSITFSESIAAGTGNLVVKKASDNSVVATTAVSAATINGSQLSWSVTGLQSATAYYVEVPATAITDIAGNSFAGIAGATWAFTTADLTAPTLVSTNPANNAINVSVTPTLQMTFSERVVAGTGNILVKKVSDNTVAATVAVSATTIANNVVSIPVTGLAGQTQYYVEVPATAYKDTANNFFAGFSGSGTWKFTTLDNTAPTLVTFAPPNNQVGVPINPTPLSFTFSEAIAAGTGNLLIKRMIDGSIAATVPATSAIINGSNAVFLIPGLVNSTQYFVEIQNTAFKDLSGNAYAGFSGSTTFVFFTTAITAVPSVDPASVAFVIQPNPTSNNLKFTFLPKAGKVSYQVIDAKGVIVLQTAAKSVTANKLVEAIGINGLPAGSYMLKIVNNGNFTVQQFIKR
ncbi:MAG: C-terminal target protein [Flaviaesturariibacter sp.]|nr:C-terminal target protein [Flaviaesturariibacter sp.]